MKKGNKPDFHQSANGLKAKTLYHAFFKRMGELYTPDKVKDGVFAAMMDVALVNDGPVGVDYSCLDGEVHPHILQHPVLSSAVHHVLTCCQGDHPDRYRSAENG